jgi:hypothetical protein
MGTRRTGERLGAPGGGSFFVHGMLSSGPP